MQKYFTSIKKNKIIIAACAGNVLEWYDFALYGYLAAILAKLFFPTSDNLASLIATFGVFAAGFIMRPFGALVFGYLGDKIGRKQTLIISIFLMAIPTTLICILPVYSQIGLLAPILLIIIRLLQGFSIGGEFTGSISYLVEKAPNNRRGFYGSWTYFSTFTGSILGSFVAAITTICFSDSQLYSWGWRIPFLLGIVLAFIGLYMRKGIDETKVFKTLKNTGNISTSPLKETFKNHWKQLLIVIGSTCVIATSTYMIFIYMVTYISISSNIPLSTALTINTISMIFLIILIPLFGYLSDIIGRKPILITASLGIILLSYPLFLLMYQENNWYYALSQLVFTIMISMFQGVSPALYVELLPAKTRMSSLSIGYNLAQVIFGGMTPLIATLLVKYSGIEIAPAFYLIICSIISIIVYLNIQETHKRELQ